MKTLDDINVVVANVSHMRYTTEINDTIDSASKERGTGIARRSDEYINNKILEGKAIIALDGDGFAGFCYIESWGHNRFVANSGLIVKKDYRGLGLAKEIKKKAFELSRTRYPDAKIFGLTTGLAVMKINHELGYRPVTFSELTDDDDFWKGCQSCVNYDILTRTGRSKCLCTGMLFDPAWEKEKAAPETKQETVAGLKHEIALGTNEETSIDMETGNITTVKPRRSVLLEIIGKLKPKGRTNGIKATNGVNGTNVKQQQY